MQIKSRLFRFITVIVLTVCGILTFVLLEFTNTRSLSSDFPVPGDAEVIFDIDARQLIQSDMKEILFVKDDAQLVKELLNRIKSRQESENQKLPIDLLHRVLFYTVTRNEHRYLAFLFYVSDKNNFEAALAEMKHTSGAVKDHIGILLTSLDETVSPDQQLAAELLNSPLSKNKGGAETPLQIATGKDNRFLPGLKAAIHLTDHRLIMNGKINHSAVTASAFSVKQEGLFVHSFLFPQNLLDSINAHLPTVNLKIEQLRFIDFNYKGLLIDNSDGIKALPRINAVIGSAKNISVANILAEIPATYRHGDSIVLPGMTYVLKQLDDQTIFFGVDPGSIVKRTTRDLICIEGHLGNLMDIDASPMILSVVEIMAPQLRPSREFAAATEKIHFCVGKNGSNKVEAEVLFRKDKSAYAEFTRLLIGLQAINN